MNNSKVLILIAWAVFLAHILGNLVAVRPTPQALDRLQGIRELSVFPPDWVFSIWLVIWVLQFAMLAQTFGSPFWTVTTASLFILVCAGNLGSQLAGARNAPWFVYLGCLGLMLLAALGFMLRADASSGMARAGIWASQLYVGWASLALVLGVGVILVCDQAIIPDRAFTIAALAVVVSVPVAIWASWAYGLPDYRAVSIPYALLLLSLGLRQMVPHGAG